MSLRCWQVIEDRLYAVMGDRFVRIAADGLVTTLGTLLTTGPRAWMDYNQFHIAIADDYYGYLYSLTAETFSQISDFTAGHGMTFSTGFLLSGGLSRGAEATRCYASGVFDATTWDGLAFGSVESSPDPLLLPFTHKDSVIMFGEASIEVWNYNGDGSAFPFSFLPGTASRYGLAAIESAVPFMGSVVALFRSGNELLAGIMQGYEVISLMSKQRAVAAEWQTYERVEDAIGTTYSIQGMTIYQLTFPTANRTWAYEGVTGIWVRLETAGGAFLGQRAIAWNGDTLMAAADGALYRFDADAVKDGEAYLATTLVSQRLAGLSRFATVDKLTLELEVGTTPVGPGLEPTLTVSLSPDGGHTYKPGHSVTLGNQGDYLTRPTVRRLGRAKDIVIKVTGGGINTERPIRHTLSSASELDVS